MTVLVLGGASRSKRTDSRFVSYPGSFGTTAPEGTVVGCARAIDPDENDVIAYDFAKNPYNRFAIDALSGQITKTGTSGIDPGTYTLLVRTTDLAGNTLTKPISIVVNASSDFKPDWPAGDEKQLWAGPTTVYEGQMADIDISASVGFFPRI